MHNAKSYTDLQADVRRYEQKLMDAARQWEVARLELETENHRLRLVCNAATRWWRAAVVAQEAHVEYATKQHPHAESRLRSVAADAALQDAISALGEAIDHYERTG